MKDVLDPNGILNPDKMFTLFKVWAHSRLKIELPWDHKYGTRRAAPQMLNIEVQTV